MQQLNVLSEIKLKSCFCDAKWPQIIRVVNSATMFWISVEKQENRVAIEPTFSGQHIACFSLAPLLCHMPARLSKAVKQLINTLRASVFATEDNHLIQ